MRGVEVGPLLAEWGRLLVGGLLGELGIPLRYKLREHVVWDNVSMLQHTRIGQRALRHLQQASRVMRLETLGNPMMCHDQRGLPIGANPSRLPR